MDPLNNLLHEAEHDFENGMDFSSDREVFHDRRQERRRSVVGRARLILGTDEERIDAKIYDCAVLEASDHGCRVEIRQNLERCGEFLGAIDSVPEISGEFLIELADQTRHRAVVRWSDTNELGVEIFRGENNT